MKVIFSGYNSEKPSVVICEGDGGVSYPGFETVLDSSANKMFYKFINYNAITYQAVPDSSLPDIGWSNFTLKVQLCKYSQSDWAILFTTSSFSKNMIGRTLQDAIASKKVFAYTSNMTPEDTILDIVYINSTAFNTPDAPSNKFCLIYTNDTSPSLTVVYDKTASKWTFSWQTVISGSGSYNMGMALFDASQTRIDALVDYKISKLAEILDAVSSDIKSRYMVR